RPQGGQGRPHRRERPRRRGTPRARAAQTRGRGFHGQEAQTRARGFHGEEAPQTMTGPGIPSRLPDLLAQRDSSLPLAAAALARIADERGRTTFGDLAGAYREEFLQLRAHMRGASLPELGGMSLEDFRNSLRSSLLPRLGDMKVVTYPIAHLFADDPVAITPEAWDEMLRT